MAEGAIGAIEEGVSKGIESTTKIAKETVGGVTKESGRSVDNVNRLAQTAAEPNKVTAIRQELSELDQGQVPDLGGGGKTKQEQDYTIKNSEEPEGIIEKTALLIDGAIRLTRKIGGKIAEIFAGRSPAQ